MLGPSSSSKWQEPKLLAVALAVPSSTSLMYTAPPIHPGSSCLLQEVAFTLSPSLSFQCFWYQSYKISEMKVSVLAL